MNWWCMYRSPCRWFCSAHCVVLVQGTVGWGLFTCCKFPTVERCQYSGSITTDQQAFDRESNTVEVFVARLRRKLGAAFIETVRGLGYRVNGSGG